MHFQDSSIWKVFKAKIFMQIVCVKFQVKSNGSDCIRGITVCFKRSRSIWILCYDLRVLWPHKSTLQSHATPLGFWFQTDIDWISKWITIIQTPSSNGFKVTGHQSWWSRNYVDLLGSKLRFREFYIVKRCSPSDPGSIPDRCKLWRPTFLRPLGLQGQKLILLKDLIFVYQNKLWKLVLQYF